MKPEMVVLPTCEVSNDPESAIELGLEWGIRNFELKTMWNNDRVPAITAAQKEYLKGVVKDYGATIVAVSPGLFLGKPYEPAVVRWEIGEKLPRTMEFAAEFGCRRIVVFACARTEGVGEDAMVEALGEAAAAAAGGGFSLVLEPIAGSYCDSGVATGRILRAVGNPALRVNWDPGNIAAAGFKAFPDEYEPVKDLVGYVHLKNYDGATKKFELFHQGDIDLKANLARLLREGYEGYLSLETHTRWNREYPLRPIAASRKNHETLVRWLGEIRREAGRD